MPLSTKHLSPTRPMARLQMSHQSVRNDSKVIVAINKEKVLQVPGFGVTDYGLEADLLSIVPELVKSL